MAGNRPRSNRIAVDKMAVYGPPQGVLGMYGHPCPIRILVRETARDRNTGKLGFGKKSRHFTVYSQPFDMVLEKIASALSK